MTWKEARAFCSEKGGHLVTITSLEEQSFIESILRDGEKLQYWIGMTTEGGTPEWINGEPYSFSHWNRNEPNHSKRSDGEVENYIQIYNFSDSNHSRYYWNDCFNDNYWATNPNFSQSSVGVICEWDSENDGDNSKTSDVHYIYTVSDLVDISKDLTGTYYLQNNLDLSHYGNWAPIGHSVGETSGDDANVFTGIFDGQGHSITGMTISTEDSRTGLFSVVSGGGIVRNLHVDAIINAGAGVGVITGYLRNGTISNVFTSGRVTGMENVGGIAGACGYWGTSVISNCYTTVNVQATENIGKYGYVVGCGGAVGILQHGARLENCYATGTITAPDGTNMGGIVGIVWNNSPISHCYYSNLNSGAGEYKSSADMKLKSTYVGWDFDTIWAINPEINNGYPYLKTVAPASSHTDNLVIAFNPNGGIGNMESITCESGSSVWLPANTFYREGYTFNGWNTKADGSGTAYRSQAQITPTDSITLYAQWLGEITFEQETYEVEEGETITVTATIPTTESAGGFVWTPGNETVFIMQGSNHSEVSREGICTASIQVRGDSAGLCTLTLTLPDGRSGSCQIRTTQSKYSLPIYQDGDDYKFRFRSNLKDESGEDMELSYTYHYDETWFFKASTFYQHDLVRMSIRGAMAAMGAEGEASSARNITELMTRMQFRSIESSYPRPSVSSVDTANNTIGYAIGSKNIRDDSGHQFALIMVAVRGGGYYDEWGDNFNVGTGLEHAGFAGAADKVLNGLDSYLKKHDSYLDANKKIWIMGYSRGAATTNIVAKNLDDGKISGITRNNIYAFCFECPQNTRSEGWNNSLYNNIISIVNPIDFVPKVAMSEWDYHRYGRTYFTPYRAGLISTEYNRLENRMIAYYDSLINQNPGKKWNVESFVPNISFQSPKLDAAMGALSSWLDSPEEYVGSKQQQKIMDAFKNNLGYASPSINMADKIFDSLYAICNGNAVDETAIVFTASGALSAVILYFFGHPVKTIIKAFEVKDFFADIGRSHYHELCFSWLESLDGELQYVSSQKRIMYINCPVDIEVYDSNGTLVGKIEDDVPVSVENGIYTYIDTNGQKVITLPIGEEYTIQMTATDSGTVSYTATLYNMESGSTEQVVSYQDIPVSEGDTLTAVAENLEETDKAEYTLKKNGSSLKSDISVLDEEVKTYTVEVRNDGNGTALGGGIFVMGEYSQVSAEPNDDSTFVGWYQDNAQVSTENPYRFLVNSNRLLTARFSTHTNPTEQDSKQDSGNNNTTSSRDSRRTSSTRQQQTNSYVVSKALSVNGVFSVSPVNAVSGTTISITVVPNSGYKLGQLTYVDSAGETFTIRGNTFTMPASNVTVSATFVPDDSNPFSDVIAGPFYNAILWAYRNGVTTGTTTTTFSPNQSCTRSQTVTFLWRAAGSPKPTSRYNPFEDVPANAYYYDAVMWAVETGVTKGTTATTFSPSEPVRRGQVVTFLYRWNSYQENTASHVSLSGRNPFTDVWNGPDIYFYEPVLWAVGRGITNGITPTTFAPNERCTRGQIVTFIYRYKVGA